MGRKPALKDIDFSEAIADSFSAPALNRLEQPLQPFVFRLMFIAVILVAAVFSFRIFILAGWEHQKYLKRAEANLNQEIPLIAPRGIIVDRQGKPLAENEAIFSVFLKINEMARYNEKDRVLKAAEEILGLSREEVLQNLQTTAFNSITNIILKRDISREQAIAIKSLGLRSLTVEDDYKRKYSDPAFASVVGYVGLVNSQDLRENEELVLNDLIGRAGLEAFYDDRLRGKNGAIALYRNAKGEVEATTRVKEPIAGNRLETTLDADFQRYFYQRMIQALVSLGRTSGAGIAINPKNGEVLALVSLPSFDANNITPSLNNPNRPLFNRAVSGLYSPGSTIKPIHAVAALNENIIAPDRQIFSAGYIEVPNPYRPDQPSRFLDWKAHGWVNLYQAIARSSNIYFYAVGGGLEPNVSPNHDFLKGLGIERLIAYWKRFGLDQKTGIDLPGEASGFLPNPTEKEKRTGARWLIGDTYNVSIGQGDLTITPIRLLSAIAAIANNGRAFAPHLAKEREGPILIDVSDLGDALTEVRKGMEETVNQPYGTAHLLNDLPLKVAGKTGSAQIAGNTKVNALFVGYAPASNPEIAVLILIEDAKEGSLNTVPIARDVFRWYYENRLK